MSPTFPDPAVERYLDRVRASLSGMPEPEREDTPPAEPGLSLQSYAAQAATFWLSC